MKNLENFLDNTGNIDFAGNIFLNIFRFLKLKSRPPFVEIMEKIWIAEIRKFYKNVFLHHYFLEFNFIFQNEFGLTVTCVEAAALANNFFIARRLCEYHISPINIKITDIPTVVMQPSLSFSLGALILM